MSLFFTLAIVYHLILLGVCGLVVYPVETRLLK